MSETKKFVGYIRVSTTKQGDSGLGLEAQQKTVASYVEGQGGLVDEYVEIESGRKNDRPELAKALSACRVHNAVLVISRLDRLSRNAHFLLGLKEPGVEFVCCDMPSANRLTIGIMAMVAEEEARLISVRTKAALQAAKDRGVKLGPPSNNGTPEGRALGSQRAASTRIGKANQRAADLMPIIEEIRNSGIVTLGGIAGELNRRGIPTARGRTWYPTSVRNLLCKIIRA